MYALLAKPIVEKDLRSIRAEDLADLNDKIKSLAEQPNSPGSIKPKSSKALKDIVYASENTEFSMTSTTMPKP